MKAAVYSRYGPPDVVQIREVEKPVPKDNEILIKVRAAALNPLDLTMKGRPYILRMTSGLRKPRDPRLGVDVAGEVEAVGGNVTRFKPGDDVFGSCRGAFAEYACTLESRLVMKPENLTFEQAASIPVAAITALQGLRDKGHIAPGQKILIHGAAGGVGTFAVQIAKAFGAEVTGVCSTRNVEMLRSIGADQVIDYTQKDFTRSGQRYDLILDLAGNHSLLACRRAVNTKGTYVAAGVLGIPHRKKLRSFLARAIAAPVLSRLVSQNFVAFIAKLKAEDLSTVHDLTKAGQVTPVIDRCYRLSEVPEALRYLEEGHARGKVVIAFE